MNTSLGRCQECGVYHLSPESCVWKEHGGWVLAFKDWACGFQGCIGQVSFITGIPHGMVTVFDERILSDSDSGLATVQ